VLWLPTYAAHEANPAERILGLLKDKVAATCLAGSVAKLAEPERRCFREPDPHPVLLPASGEGPTPPRLVGAPA